MKLVPVCEKKDMSGDNITASRVGSRGKETGCSDRAKESLHRIADKPGSRESHRLTKEVFHAY